MSHKLPDSKQLLPWLVAIALFMESLDTTILNTAVPTIAQSLKVGPLGMKAAVSSYTLSLAVFIPISGWIADRFGTRLVFFTAIGIFSLGSLFCGLSINMPMLVASRILQGCGGALMLPVGRIALVRTFPKSELLRAMIFVAIPGLIGPLIGPLAGGFIVAYFHWRAIFFVNLPMGLIGIFLAHRYMTDFRSSTKEPLDLLGLILFGSGIATLSYVLEVFGEHTLSFQNEVLLLILSGALLAAYGFRSSRLPYPLLRLSLFRIRTFRSAVLGGFITRLGVGGMPFLLPLLYQLGLGYSPLESGLLIMPQPLAAISLRVLMPKILARFGYRWVLLFNTMFIGLVMMLFATISPGSAVWVIVVQAFCFGFLSSLQYSSMNTLIFADLNETNTSMGSSIGSTAQQMSMSFGVAVASLTTLYFVGGNRTPGDSHLIAGIHHTFIALGFITVISSLIFWQLKPDDGKTISNHAEVHPET